MFPCSSIHTLNPLTKLWQCTGFAKTFAVLAWATFPGGLITHQPPPYLPTAITQVKVTASFFQAPPPPPPSRPLFTRLTVCQANMSDRRWVSALCRGKYLKFTRGPRCPLQLHTHTAHAAALACRGCFTTVWLGPTVT